MDITNDTDRNGDEEKNVIRRSRKKSLTGSESREHKEQLQKLTQKDPEFYEFLKENDEELLEFEHEDIDEDAGTDLNDEDLQQASPFEIQKKEQKTSKKVITISMVDSWCESIHKNGSLNAVRSLMRAFRIACHYGDDGENESMTKLSVISSAVFNKIMSSVLTEMNRILRKLLKLPDSGGNRETITDLMTTKHWRSHAHLVKSYLGNALHVLNQMTDPQMISFTLHRLKFSSLFLTAFPSLLRKYIKVVLHFWGTGEGDLPKYSYLFMEALCISIGSGCIDECFKGIYKSYVLSCHFVNAMKLQHIQFLGDCVIYLFRLDLQSAYQHAFVFIRQLAMILREALNTKTKESFRKVYGWKFINCLELWTGAICTYSSNSDLKQLAYPLTQIVSGVARLVPTAKYFPLRLRCIRMLNQIAKATQSFIPVSMLLLDMLEMKELNKPPTGGVGKAVDLRTVLKVSKPTLKTRAFQEACVFYVVGELAEHLALWSYSVAFMELSFIPLVRLRSFCKSTKVERFRKEMRQLILQAEANCDFVNGRRMSVSFLPNDSAAASFLQDEKGAASSPLSKYLKTLCQRAQERNDSLMESSVLVGEDSSVFRKKLSESVDIDDGGKNEEGTAVFNSSWLPGKAPKTKQDPKETKRKRKKQGKERAIEDDVVEDLVLSSDDDDDDDDDLPSSNDHSAGKNDVLDHSPPKQKRKQKKQKRKTKRLKSHVEGK